MTGTPMENKVEEFRVLVGLLRPDVAENLARRRALDGTTFRERVARSSSGETRKTCSVLPDRLETQERAALEGAAMQGAGRRPGRELMAMRRAAFDPHGEGIEKLRLVEEDRRRGGLRRAQGHRVFVLP